MARKRTQRRPTAEFKAQAVKPPEWQGLSDFSNLTLLGTTTTAMSVTAMSVAR